ncbi:MAG: DUF1905 domain-containing protein [Vagococcus sp.]
MSQTYTYTTEIVASEIGKGGAYVVFPYDIREEFGKGRVKVSVLFDTEAYEDGSICYIIGIRKDIRKALNKDIGDQVTVQVKERVD